MQAFVYTEYGSADGLRLQEVPRPVPTDDEVLIRLAAVSVNGADSEALVGRPLYTRLGGLRKPRHQILGSDIAGRVEQVGHNVRAFHVGDEVFGELPGYHGGFAEYACAPEKTLAHKPASLTFAQAAALPQAGAIALRGIRTKGQVQPGQRVLINGAGGSAGPFIVQLAKQAGAEVTGVDSTAKLDFLRALGADHVIDYTQTDFTRTGQQYDLILDVTAHHSAFACARALRPQGTYFCVGGSVAVLLQILLLGRLIKVARSKHVRILIVPQGGPELRTLAELAGAGQLTPVIDRCYPFAELPAALRYVAEGRHLGKVVITFARTSTS